MAKPRNLRFQAIRRELAWQGWQFFAHVEDPVDFSNRAKPWRQELQPGDGKCQHELLLRAVCAALQAFPPI